MVGATHTEISVAHTQTVIGSGDERRGHLQQVREVLTRIAYRQLVSLDLHMVAGRLLQRCIDRNLLDLELIENRVLNTGLCVHGCYRTHPAQHRKPKRFPAAAQKDSGLVNKFIHTFLWRHYPPKFKGCNLSLAGHPRELIVDN